MENRLIRNMVIGLGGVALVAAGTLGAWAQNSLPAPGSGGSYNPGGGWGGGFNPGPPPPAWGSPWGPGWYTSPTIIVNTPLSTPDWQDQGVTNVVACGYDIQGVWRTLPLRVSYHWNGVQYNVTVLNAWNPWTDMWDKGVDQPAYNTDYTLNGTTFDFYAPLSTGTYYFNLR